MLIALAAVALAACSERSPSSSSTRRVTKTRGASRLEPVEALRAALARRPVAAGTPTATATAAAERATETARRGRGAAAAGTTSTPGSPPRRVRLEGPNRAIQAATPRPIPPLSTRSPAALLPRETAISGRSRSLPRPRNSGSPSRAEFGSSSLSTANTMDVVPGATLPFRTKDPYYLRITPEGSVAQSYVLVVTEK